MNPILAALAALIQPAINYAEQKLESVGAAVLASFFIKEEGQEGTKVIQMTITGMELAVENSLKTA